MELYLNHRGTVKRATDTAVSWTLSGEKSAPVRQLTAQFVFDETLGLPTPEIGDQLTLTDEDGKRVFTGPVLKRTAGSEDKTMSCTSYDYGIYLNRNDGTYRFADQTAEEITRRVCRDREIPVVAVPTTGMKLRRKFAGVTLAKIIGTVWSLAEERTGERYAIRYTPDGLLVKKREETTGTVILKGAGRLMDATTAQDATQAVNSVAIYDSKGNFLRRSGDSEGQKLLGVMERHITKNTSNDADKQAKQMLEDGGVQTTVTVNALGDLSLISGETVVVQEEKTGLQGVFWIDGDVHTWKRGNYYTKLTLNCRNVTTRLSAGSELK